jgi:hypothetical protein
MKTQFGRFLINGFFLIILSFCCVAISGQNKSSADSQSSLVAGAIKDAKLLVVNGDRRNAIAQLQKTTTEIKSEHLKKKINDEIQNLGELFLTDKAQQAFESAESVRFAGEPGFQKKYLEAFELENDNLKVLRGLIESSLATGACSQAIKVTGELKLFYMRPIEEAYYQLRGLLCQDGLTADGLIEIWSQVKSLELDNDFRITLFEARKVLDGDLRPVALKTNAEISKAILAIRSNGYFYFVAWKEKKDFDAAAKYIEDCKNITVEQRRSYRKTPHSCMEMPKVAELLEKEKIRREQEEGSGKDSDEENFEMDRQAEKTGDKK